MSITIHDLASMTGLNASTISRALRHDPKVKDATRKRIEQLAAEHGYVPNQMAKNLASGKTGMVAMVISSLGSEMERVPAIVLNEVLEANSRSMMLLINSGRKDFFTHLLERLEQKICDGAIIILPTGSQINDSVRSKLEHMRIPLLYLDRWLEGSRTPVVTTDNAGATKCLAQMALENGMERALVYFDSDNAVARIRKAAAESFLRTHSIPYRCFSELDDGFAKEVEGKKMAVFADSNYYIHQESLKNRFQPSEFIGVFFDASPIYQRELYGTIVTAYQDFERIGRVSGETILALLEHRPVPEPIHMIPCREYGVF